MLLFALSLVVSLIMLVFPLRVVVFLSSEALLAAHPAIAAEAAAAGVATLLAEQEDAYELIAGTAITAAP